MSLLLLLGLLALLGLSISDVRLLSLDGSAPSASGGLVGLTLIAGLVGFLLASSPLGLLRAHLVGAALAAFLLLMTTGAMLLGESSPLPLTIGEISARVSVVWVHLGEEIAAYLADHGARPTTATYLLLGAICWTTAQFSAFSIFRYQRAGPAVMAIGAVLFLDTALGSAVPEAVEVPVLPLLTAFSGLAMLLLLRLQFLEQRRQWARRSISDTGEVGRLFLRSGSLFVLIAVLAATSMTAWATLDRQEVDLGDLQEPVESIGEQLADWLVLLGVAAPAPRSTTIDTRWSVGERWQQPSGVAFQAEVDGQLRGNYWWGTAHDSFDGQTWERTRLEGLDIPAGEPLPIEVLASAGGDHLATTTLTVEGEGVVRGTLFRLAEAGVISRDVQAAVVDEGGGIGDLIFEDPLALGDSVEVDSWVRDYSPDSHSLTANELRAAGDDYPGWTDRYLQGADQALAGERVSAEARRIERRFDDPYDRALEVQRSLREMEYTTDMRGVCGADETIPECVLRSQRGFCQHYATTMAMLLRAMGIPSRIVTGYLPGERVDEVWVVDQAAYHNWVEAYFPSYGWVRFDPTPRDEFGITPTALPDGPLRTPQPELVAPTSQPDDIETIAPEETAEPLLPDETSPGSAGGMGGPLLVGGSLAVLLVLVSSILFLRFRRLGEPDGSVAYRGIVSLATRLGRGPNPAQTELEYAEQLSESLPSVRDDIYLVAGARVQSAYGRRRVESEGQGALRRAYGRVRTALLRLSLRWRQRS